MPKEVLHSRIVDPELHKLVKGLMIESYIEPGNQKIGCDHIYGKSITDPCLGWEESEKLLYTMLNFAKTEFILALLLKSIKDRNTELFFYISSVFTVFLFFDDP